jgi:hypothetical protein
MTETPGRPTPTRPLPPPPPRRRPAPWNSRASARPGQRTARYGRLAAPPQARPDPMPIPERQAFTDQFAWSPAGATWR